MKIIQKISIVLIVSLFLTLSGSAVASAQGEGAISGHIANQSAGGTVPEGQTVTLATFYNSAQTDTQETTPDESGNFIFNNLDTSANYSYQLSTTYSSVRYFGDMLTFDDNTTTLSAELPIFETDNSSDQIHIVTSHIIMYPSEDHMDVLEYYLFLNDSDRTFTGTTQENTLPSQTTLQFSLPDTAQNLQAQVGFTNDAIVGTSGGFSITTPIAPGMIEIGFSYSTDFSKKGFTYLKDVTYPIDAIDLLVSGTDTKVTTDQMYQNDPIQIQGSSFQDFSADNLTSGQQLKVTLSQGSSSSSGAIILIVVVIVLLAGGIFYIMYSRRKQEKEPAPRFVPETDSDLLLSRLAKLDDDYEDGIIDETEYRAARDDLKAKLAELLAKETGTTED